MKTEKRYDSPSEIHHSCRFAKHVDGDEKTAPYYLARKTSKDANLAIYRAKDGTFRGAYKIIPGDVPRL